MCITEKANGAPEVFTRAIPVVSGIKYLGAAFTLLGI